MNRINRAFTLFFTGLPASGKTTLANSLYSILSKNFQTQVLDSDDFASNLGEFFEFSSKGRALNNRCMSVVCQYLNKHGVVCLLASTSPQQITRNANLKLIESSIEVYCECSLETAEKRDPKGLYKLARQNKIVGFTGVSGDYEEPLSPDIIVNTESDTVSECIAVILDYLKKSFKINIDEYSSISNNEKAYEKK